MRRFLSALLRGLAYFGVYAALQAGVSLFAGLILALVPGYAAPLKHVLTENINLLLIISGTITLLTFAMMLKTQHMSIRRELSLYPVALTRLLPLVIGGVALNFLVSTGMELIPIPEHLINDYNESSGLLLEGSPGLQLVSVVIMAPVVEEVTFRGLMLNRFSQGMSIAAAVLIQAALFGVMHGSPVWIAYGFMIGLLLGAVMMLYRSLLACVALHMAFNAASYIVELVPATETVLLASLFICAAMAIIVVKSLRNSSTE